MATPKSMFGAGLREEAMEQAERGRLSAAFSYDTEGPLVTGEGS